MLTRAELTKWTSALRANPEQQIRGKLTSDGSTGFCCLGKLCQVMGLKPDKIPVAIPSLGDFDLLVYEGERNYLPNSIADKLGMMRMGVFRVVGMPNLNFHHSAAEANDHGATWPEIADHFDKYYPCSDEGGKVK